MDMNTNMQIMKKINNGFGTKKDRISSVMSSESHFDWDYYDKSEIHIQSKGIGLFIFMSNNLSLDQMMNIITKPMGHYKLEAIVSDNIYSSKMMVGDNKSIEIIGLPENEILDIMMK